ncbi:hypothetical protein Cgig2_017546 [Carnegiea gigantea]|uniref:Uncharacterized protein n=1 Tax=Carnegiea gigantea TaxID=171969 RepID=A0A9Q1KM28_9CARY|nr:hypothetical protein Cgig2_017546 [Carnegiea gigantea]
MRSSGDTLIPCCLSSAVPSSTPRAGRRLCAGCSAASVTLSVAFSSSIPCNDLKDSLAFDVKCGQEPKALFHALFHCKEVEPTWTSMGCDELVEEGLREGCFRDKIGDEGFISYLTKSKALWTARSEKVLQGSSANCGGAAKGFTMLVKESAE